MHVILPALFDAGRSRSISFGPSRRQNSRRQTSSSTVDDLEGALPMTLNRPRRVALAASLTLSGLALAACSSGQDSTSPAAGAPPASAATGAPASAAAGKTGALRIAYLQKQGDQQYFVDEADGAKSAATKLGNVEVTVVDLGTDANAAISQLDSAIAQKYDAIAIVVPDQKIGPQVIQAAQTAGIPLLASDDPIMSGSGAAAPFVGFDGPKMGAEVGKKAAELYKAAGYTAADTRIIAAWKQDQSNCTDRVDGAAKAFGAAVPGGPKTIEIGTDNSATDAQDKAGATLTGNRGVKHWVVWGCNDENETGVVTALQNGGVQPANVIGVGLGAYLDCKDWKAGQVTGNKASLFIDGKEVGASAVSTLVTSLRKGTALPANTVAKTTLVDKDTWQQSGLVCT
jgi:L-arabinose transport system substrate-binding protein